MRITIFNGSPWAEEGHTHIMTRNFAMGAIYAGAKVRVIQLSTKKIKPCNECGTCFYKTPGECVIKDDMQDLIKKFMSSDVVAFATPVYIDNVTALMKVFIDRLLPILKPRYVKDTTGCYRHSRRFNKYPGFLVISSCAMPDQNNFQVIKLFFKRMARTMHTEVLGEICHAAAGVLLLSREELRFRPMASEYKKLLAEAGIKFVKVGRIDKEMTQRLQQPIIDPDEYVNYANKMWNQLLAKHGLLKVLA